MCVDTDYFDEVRRSNPYRAHSVWAGRCVVPNPCYTLWSSH